MNALVPIDIKSIEPKLIFGLTKRQIICGAIGIIPVVPAYFLCNKFLGNSIALMVAIAFACPGFALIIYKKNGMPAEQILKAYAKWKLIHPQVYKTSVTKANKKILKKRGII